MVESHLSAFVSRFKAWNLNENRKQAKESKGELLQPLTNLGTTTRATFQKDLK